MARTEKEKVPTTQEPDKFVIRKSSSTTNRQASWLYFKEMSKNNITYASGKHHGRLFDSREEAEPVLAKIKEEFLFRPTDVYEIVCIYD